MVTPSDDIDHFIFYVNDILSEVNTSYNQRMAAKKDPSQPPLQGEEEVSPEASEPSETEN